MFVCPPSRYGGSEVVVWDLANALTELGHKVVLFAPKGSQLPNNGFLVECPPPEEKVQTDWVQAERRMFDYYWDYLKDWDGIIHGHGWFGFEYLAKARNPQLKVIHTHHGGLNLDYWRRSPPPFKLNMVAISDWMVRVYASQGFTAKSVHNGINMARYPLKRKKDDRLLFLGRISKIKAPHLAIEVAKKANLGLDVVGGTSFVDDPAYVEYVMSLCDGEKIRFVGEVSHEDKLKYLQNARMLVVPSSWGEPFGLHVVEAMAVGTPVIALPDGGIAETVKQGGILCTDLDSIVAAIPEVGRITPIMCRRNAELFSRARMAENYLKLYKSIVLENSDW
jgi:glycosyltransferase involved in cell wall biosynthesis